MNKLTIADFKEAISNNVFLLDTRNSDVFARGFIPGSVNISLNEKFAGRAGSLIATGATLLLITETGKETETETNLLKAGLTHVAGYLEGGFNAWQQAGETIDMIVEVEADELMMDIPFDKNLIVVDVRNEAEFAEGHLKNAINIPLKGLADPGSMANFEDEHNIYIHCGGGNSSIIAASLLKRQGIHNLRYVAGGWREIKEQKKAVIVKETKALN